MRGLYIIDADHIIRPCDDITVWGRCMADRELRRVARTTIGDVDISTVFLGMDHGWGWMELERPVPPVVFETMTFGPAPIEGICARCCTWEEAETQHREVCDEVRAALARSTDAN